MIKYKKWIYNIYRNPPIHNSRFNELRLEKNERIEDFEKSLLSKFKKQINSTYLNAYPETYSLYEMLAKHHKLNKNNFLITAGSDAGIRACFDVFVKLKSKVISTYPNFAMVNVYSKLFNAKISNIKYDKNLNLDLKKIIDQIDKQTSIVVIANPNGCTGTLFNINEIKGLLVRAKLKKVPVLIDEAYFGFSKLTAIELVRRYPNLIVSRTFSKAYGIAGLRVGYLVGSSNIINLLNKFKPMYEINSLGILLAKILIKNKEIARSYISNSEKGKLFLLHYFKKKKIKTINTHANFVLVQLKKNKLKIIRELEKRRIFIGRSIEVSGMEDFVRITIGPILPFSFQSNS